MEFQLMSSNLVHSVTWRQRKCSTDKPKKQSIFKNYLNTALKDTPQMTALCPVMLTLSSTYPRLSITGEKKKKFIDTTGEIWVMKDGKARSRAGNHFFLMQSAMCNSPSAPRQADDMPKHQEGVYEESLSFVSISVFIILRVQNKHSLRAHYYTKNKTIWSYGSNEFSSLW